MVGVADAEFADFEDAGLEDLGQPLVEPARRLAVGRGVDGVGQVGVEGLVVKPLQQPASGPGERLLILCLQRLDLLAGVEDRGHLVGRHAALVG